MLRDLVAHNGQISISVDDTVLKQRAEFLVEIGYATLDPITMTVVRLRVTHLGRTAKVLADFGICSPDFCAIEPQLSEADGTWRIKVSTVGKPPITVDVAAAAEMVVLLQDAGAIDVARHFRAEVERTRRYMDGRLRVGL